MMLDSDFSRFEPVEPALTVPNEKWWWIEPLTAAFELALHLKLTG